MEIREVKKSEWPMLVPIFKQVFASDMPPPEHGKFIGVFDEGRIEAFLLMEEITVIDQVWSRGEKNKPQYVRRMVKFVRDIVPPRQTVATVFDGRRYEMLFKALGFLKIPGTLFRRNGI